MGEDFQNSQKSKELWNPNLHKQVETMKRKD